MKSIIIQMRGGNVIGVLSNIEIKKEDVQIKIMDYDDLSHEEIQKFNDENRETNV
jgi:hypothetical protein